MSIYSGDEIYGDDVTSGPLSDDEFLICPECGQHVEDGDWEGHALDVCPNTVHCRVCGGDGYGQDPGPCRACKGSGYNPAHNG